MGFFDSALSIATGGAWDAVKAIDNVIDHSDSRDWIKLFTGGLSELYTGVKEGDVWGGFLRSVGGVIDNPLINASDDYLTRTGTITQRLMNDAGWMSDKVYQKNYDYTKGIAHAVGMLFAGGASSALPAGGGAAPAGAGVGGVGVETGATNAMDITADMAGNAAYNAALDEGASELAAQAAYKAAYEGTMKSSLWNTLGKAALKGASTLAKGEFLTPNNTKASFDKQWSDLKDYQKIGAFNNSNASGLIKSPSAPDYMTSDTPSPTPSFAKTDLPKLTDYGDSKDKKIAEALTDEYKNYKLNDYMLYKQDPEKLQDLILRYT